jgi:hypothetical protein
MLDYSIIFFYNLFAVCTSNTTGNPLFAECEGLALGKAWHSAKAVFAEGRPFGTRQIFFLFFWHQIVFEALLHYHKQHVKIWHIFIAFGIFL